MEPGINCDELGVVTIVDDNQETMVTFKRPTFGQFRAVNDKVDEYRKALTDLRAAIQTTIDPDAKPADKKKAEQLQQDTEASEVIPPLLRYMVDAVPHEGDLPEKVDDWPVWLVTDWFVPTEIIGHWTRRPKVSGLNGQ